MQTTTRGVVVIIFTIGFVLCRRFIHMLEAINLFIRQIVQAFATKEPEQTTVEHRHQLRMMCADMSQQVLTWLIGCIPVFRELIKGSLLPG